MSLYPSTETYRRRRRAIALLIVLVLTLLSVAGYLVPRAADKAIALMQQRPSAASQGDVMAQLEKELAAHKARDYDTGGMDPTFRKQLNKAVAAAKRDKVTVTLLSGYRPYSRQEQLYREQVARTGSIEEARKLVLPPWKSMHVRGKAVDVDKPFAAWLRKKGAAYGFCQRYANEWWHFEMLTVPGGTCPEKDPNAAEGNPGR